MAHPKKTVDAVMHLARMGKTATEIQAKMKYLARSTIRDIIKRHAHDVAPSVREQKVKKHAPRVESVVLVIPDIHCPFEHPDALAFLCAVRDKIKPTHVVCLGDEMDFHAISRWPSNPDGLSAGQEYARGVEHLLPFYREFPDVLVCTSNHTVRPFKKAFEAGLPAAMMPSYSTMLRAPEGWVWEHSHVIDNVRYIHGEGKSGQNSHLAFIRAYKQSVVHGHIHSYAAVSYEGETFGMNAGCLIDPKAYAYAYAKNMPIAVNLGCGIVTDGRKAVFLPMPVDKEGRWTGEL